MEIRHNIDEESFDRIFGDIKEICCQTNSNETQVGKRKILLKNFYQCSFCKQVFTKDHQKLKNHIKKFHKFEEEDFQNKSNKFIEENFSNKKTLKILKRKMDDSDEEFKLKAKKHSMKSIDTQTKLINENVTTKKMNKVVITNIKSIKNQNSTTSNKKRKKPCLSSISDKLKKHAMKSINSQTKLTNENLSREKKNKAEITKVKSMKKRNSTTSNEKKESQCLSSISIESKNQPREKKNKSEITNVKSMKKRKSTTSIESKKLIKNVKILITDYHTFFSTY